MDAIPKGEVVQRLARKGVDAWYSAQRRGLSITDPDTLHALLLTQPYSMLSQRKRLRLRTLGLKVLASTPVGDVAEIGVNRGGGLGVLADRLASGDRTVHLFDRWGDLPQAGVEDGVFHSIFDSMGIERIKLEADLDASLAAALELYTEVFTLPAERLRLHQGWYDDTLASYDSGPLCFVHLDSDFYSSTVTALDFLDTHLAPSATVLLDDWGVWPGVEQATREHLATTRRPVRLKTYRSQATLTYGGDGR